MKKTHLLVLAAMSLTSLSTLAAKHTDTEYDAVIDIDNLKVEKESKTKSNRFLKKVAMSKVRVGAEYFVDASSLNVRNANNEVLGKVGRNDVVKVVSSSTPLAGNYIQVSIVSTSRSIQESSQYFVSADYLSTNKSVYTAPKDASKYFVVQNIATERVRIYEKNCNSAGQCNNKMVFETEVVAGEDSKKAGTRSVLGAMKISSWNKFYMDGAGKYPRWYSKKTGLPHSRSAGYLKWAISQRGAFGWYAAKVTPNSHYQWMHGTYGWGESGDEFIKATKKKFVNVVSDPRSHGCTRFNNEAIAYVRELLPVGTPIYKIYAMESVQDSSRSRYTKTKDVYKYILTSVESNGDSGKSGMDYVLDNYGPSQFIDAGTMEIDAYPNPVKFIDGGSKTKSGNTYSIDRSDMIGTFYVDTGMVKGYRHPRSLTVGGYKGVLYGSYMDVNNYNSDL